MSGALFVVEFKDRLTYRPPSLITPSGRHFCSTVDVKRKRKEAVDSRLLPTASCPLFLPTVEEYPFVSNGDLQFEDYARAPGRQVVKSGRLRSLVGWLTADENKSREFERVFLLTYRSFVSRRAAAGAPRRTLSNRNARRAPPLGRLLVGGGRELPLPGRIPLSDPKESAGIPFPLDSIGFRGISTEIRRFSVRSSISWTRSDEFTPLQRIWATEPARGGPPAVGRQPTSAVRRRDQTEVQTGARRRRSASPTAIRRLSPNQLTLLHFQLFRAIRGSELMIDFSTKLTFWTVREIVDEAAVQKRAALMRRVLEVMVECEKLRNFTAKLSEEDRERLGALRFALRAARPRESPLRLRSAAAQPAVPFVGAFLSQLFFLHTSRPTFLDGNEPAEEAEISFRKCRKTAAVINSLLKFRRRSFEISPNWKLLKALISVDPSRGFADRDELEAFLYERSRRIEPN
ncbi:Son of sevenless-like protein 1 [Aphelenchoides fujianensis]|nr:Son of sevenless-like protein 1 [Aphelenchoides fujianensis]